MAIQWSGWEGGTYTGFRVGMDVSYSPTHPSHSNTSVTVTVKYYVGFSGAVDDDETYHKGGDGSGTINFHASAGNGTSTKLIDTDTHTYTLSYTSTGTKTYTASLSGVHNGATPSKSVSVNLPERPVAVPDTPSTPSVVIDGSTSLHVNWSKPNGNGDTVDLMQVQVATAGNYDDPDDDHADGTSPSYSSGLDPYTTYYAHVRAHNSAGWSGWSYSDSARTDGTAPGKISFTISDYSPSHPFLYYSYPSAKPGCDYVQVQVDNNSDMSSPFISYTDTNGSPAGPGGVGTITAGVKYYYRMRAHNSVGYGAWSTIKSFTSAPGFTIPSVTRSPTVGSISKTTATLSWTAPSSNGGNAISSYSVSVKDGSDEIVSDDTGSTSYALTGLTPNHSYSWTVVANNDAGNGSSSGTTFKTLTGVRRWSGSAWVDATIFRRWTGTAWVDVKVKHSTGTGTGNWTY